MSAKFWKIFMKKFYIRILKKLMQLLEKTWISQNFWRNNIEILDKFLVILSKIIQKLRSDFEKILRKFGEHFAEIFGTLWWNCKIFDEIICENLNFKNWHRSGQNRSRGKISEGVGGESFLLNQKLKWKPYCYRQRSSIAPKWKNYFLLLLLFFFF